VYPHSKACQVVSKLVRLGRGNDLLFHCPHPEDPKWFPPELRTKVRDCWWEGGVLVDELACIVLWGPQLLSSGELPMMEKPEPGWDDYHAFVGELAGSSADRQGMLAMSIVQIFFDIQLVLFFFNPIAMPLTHVPYL
jgi:hypothetical protein